MNTGSGVEVTPLMVVHPPLGTGGRRVTVRGEILGLAQSDEDVIEFLRGTGLPDADALLDDPAWVKWRGGRAHHFEPVWRRFRNQPVRALSTLIPID